MSVKLKESGIITNSEGEKVILLPSGPIIKGKVQGAFEEHEYIMVDDPDLGRPTKKILPSKILYKRPY